MHGSEESEGRRADRSSRALPSRADAPTGLQHRVGSTRYVILTSVRHGRETDLRLAAVGGRTAWSSTVTIEGTTVSARYWYDGQWVDNAKEDAAEVALQQLRGITTS